MKRSIFKLLLVVLLVFSMGQLGGCLNCVTDTGSISGMVTDATTGSPLSGATVKVGTITTTTGSDGKYKLENVPAGLQNVSASKTGYITDSQSVLVIGGQETTNVNFSLSPVLPSGQWRIVLTWGATPSDLNSNLLVPESDTNGVLGYHIFYGSDGSQNPDSYPYGYLDCNDTDGYGPETITIFRRLTQKYKYYVSRYSEDGDLISSGAKVEVYIGSNLVKIYNVPNSGTGIYWYVFDINADGTITDQNIIQNSGPIFP